MKDMNSTVSASPRKSSRQSAAAPKQQQQSTRTSPTKMRNQHSNPNATSSHSPNPKSNRSSKQSNYNKKQQQSNISYGQVQILNQDKNIPSSQDYIQKEIKGGISNDEVDFLLTPEVLMQKSKLTTPTKTAPFPFPSSPMVNEKIKSYEDASTSSEKSAVVVNILELLARKDNAFKIADNISAAAATASMTPAKNAPSAAITSSHPSNVPARPLSPPTRDLPIRQRRNSNGSLPSSPMPSPNHSANSTESPSHQRWAGPSFSNAPAPSALPIPAFLTEMQPSRDVSSVARQLDFSSSAAPVQHHAPFPFPISYAPGVAPHVVPIAAPADPHLAHLSSHLKMMLNIAN